MIATAAHATSPSHLVSPASSRWSGERVRFTARSMPAIFPISVSEPVAVKVTEAALTGNLADRARKAALDDAREAVRQVGSK